MRVFSSGFLVKSDLLSLTSWEAGKPEMQIISFYTRRISEVLEVSLLICVYHVGG